MSEEKIVLENVGPVSHLEINLGEPGITILSGPNGSGKTTSLEGIQKTATGKGKMSVKDGERSGLIEMPGAKCTISAVTRHKNSKCTVVNLEDQFSLGDLVDPGLKSDDAADARRIKALVGLTGVEADIAMFNGKDFSEIDQLVIPETTDLVEMSAMVKREFERMARESEKFASAEDVKAKTLSSTLEVLDSDLVPLPIEEARKLHQGAIIALTRSNERFQIEEQQKIQRKVAKEEFDARTANSSHKTADELNSLSVKSRAACDKALAKVRALEQKLSDARKLGDAAIAKTQQADKDLVFATEHESMLNELRKTFEADTSNAISPVQIAKETAEVSEYEARLDFSKKSAHNAATLSSIDIHLSSAAHAKGKSVRCRKSAALTDTVISNAIHCKHLKVETLHGNTRLVVDHARGPSTWFGDLSEGERWLIAIDIALDQPVFANLEKGQNAIIVIPQHAWESLDIKARNKISNHAVKRGIHVLTAEATRDEIDGDEIIVKKFGGAK
tara:strand:+ start:8497 stop:10008 length:1512 start_codon:yes stop_codon:yes gene_type:complete